MSAPKRSARPRNMTNTEAALYWCTEALVIPKDVPSLTGLPEAECSGIVSEIKRVRRLYTESFEPVFSSYNDVQRPLSRELAWVEKYTTPELQEEFVKFEAWARRAKVGDRRTVKIVLSDLPGGKVETFECKRVS